MSLWVVNTSPLIYLALLDRLDLLQQCADEVWVPPAVLQEAKTKPDAERLDAESSHLPDRVRELNESAGVESAWEEARARYRRY